MYLCKLEHIEQLAHRHGATLHFVSTSFIRRCDQHSNSNQIYTHMDEEFESGSSATKSFFVLAETIAVLFVGRDCHGMFCQSNVVACLCRFFVPVRFLISL